MPKSSQTISLQYKAFDAVPFGVICCSTRKVYYANREVRRYFNKKDTALPIDLKSFFDAAIISQIRMLLRKKRRFTQVIEGAGGFLNVTYIPPQDQSNLAELYISPLDPSILKAHTDNAYDDLLKKISQNFDEGITIVQDGKFVLVNNKFARLFGFSNIHHLIGKPIGKVIVKEDQQRVRSIHRTRMLGNDAPQWYEYRGLKKDGGIRDIEVTASRIEYGGKVASLSFHRDVTEKKSLEQQLRESEKLKANVFSSINQGVAVFDQKLRCVDWNDQMQIFTGVDRSQAVGNFADNLFHNFRNTVTIERLKSVLNGKKISFGYLPYTHLSYGAMRYVWVTFSPLLDGKNKVQGIVGSFSDFTHQKYMQDTVKESETLFRNVLEAMGDALVLTDLTGKVLRVNREFERLTGYPESEAVGQTIPYSWFYDPDTARFVIWISELREKNYLHDFDIRWKTKDNQIISVSLNTTLLRNEDGEPVAMLNIARDITKRKKLEDELKNRTQQIELTNRIINKANETIDIYDLLNILDRELRQVIDFDVMGVILKKGEGEYEETYFTFDEKLGQSVKQQKTGILTSLGTDLKKWKNPFSTNDLSSETERYNLLPIHQENYNSLVTVPIYSKSTYLGVLYISTREKNGFHGEEIEILQPICEQIGLILDKLHLFTKVKDDAQYIHNLLNSMDSIVFTVNQDLVVTETNTPLGDFPFYSKKRLPRKHKTLIGIPLYNAIAQAPYRTGIEKIIDALFAGNLSVYSTEFNVPINGEQKSFHLRITPMRIEGRIVGLVFNHTDITNLKKTEDELKQRNRDLIELNELSAVLTKSLNLQEVYRIFLDKILNLFNAQNVVVYLFADDALQLSGYAGEFSDMELNELRAIPLTDKIAKENFENLKPMVLTAGVEEDPRIWVNLKPMIKRRKIKSFVSIPLVVQKKNFGTLLMNFGYTREFTQQEKQLLFLIGNQLSAAIENIRLYSNLHARINDLSILASLGTIYASSFDIKKIANNVIDKVRKIRDIDAVTLSLYDEKNHQLKIIAGYGIGESGGGKVFETEDPVMRRILESRSDIILSNIAEQMPELQPYLMRQDQKSMGIFHLRTEREIVGLLSIGFTYYNRFPPEDIALYRNIATQVSMAIHNAQLYQKIQDSEEKYRLLVEGAQDMVLSMDLDGRFTYVSPSSKNLTGYSPEEILRMRFSPAAIHPDDYRYLNKIVKLVTHRKIPAQPGRALELRVRAKSGDYRWVSASWTLVHDQNGQVNGIQCILRDVHDRRIAEEEINQQFQRLQVLYELAHTLAATLDQKEIYNAVFQSVKKAIPFNLITIYLQSTQNPSIYKRVVNTVKDMDSIDEVYQEEVSFITGDYELERKVLTQRKMLDRSGNINIAKKIVVPMISKEKVLGLLVLEEKASGVFTEVQKNFLQTIAHQAGIAVEKAILYQETVDKSLEIQRRNKELDDFTYVVSHDLKEPLISIEGYSKILFSDYQDLITDDGKELMASIRQACERMKNLINELLMLSRIGRSTEDMERVELSTVVGEVLKDLEFIIRRKRAQIEIPEPLPTVYGHRVHLQILFRNLITNGIKFNNSSVPTISVKWSELNDSYQFNIEDNGVGIDEKYFDKIFLIFQRLQNDSSYEGAGAGLTIVKKIIELHGGKIWLTSKLGEGTIFYFTLPKLNKR